MFDNLSHLKTLCQQVTDFLSQTKYFTKTQHLASQLARPDAKNNSLIYTKSDVATKMTLYGPAATMLVTCLGSVTPTEPSELQDLNVDVLFC